MNRIQQALSALLIFCLLLWPAGCPAYAMTIKEEKELSKEFLTAVRTHYRVIDDFMIHQYINELGGRIVSNLPPQPFDYKFYVIDQDTVNAFAGPAGHIFVFSGLFEFMETESELAGIVAHEIAHVSARHISDLIAKSKKSQMLSMAGMIAGILVGLGGASEVGSALSMGSLAAGQSMILAYTRENELEADFLGRRYLTASDYDLYGLREALKKIRAREWFGEEQVPTYLKTHPATSQRLTNLENQLQDHPLRKSRDSFAFQRTRARLTALYGDTGRAVERFKQQISKDPQNLAARYGLALALAQSGRPESALETMLQVTAQQPDDPFMDIDLGRIYFLSGNYDKAVQTLSAVDSIAGYGPDGLFYLGRSHLSRGDFDEAIAAFQQAHKHFPEHVRSLYFLGNSYGEKGRLDLAHYHLARYYRKTGDAENARFHFNQALEKSESKDLTEKIENEIKEMKNQPDKDTKSENRADRTSSFAKTVITSDQNGKTSW